MKNTTTTTTTYEVRVTSKEGTDLFQTKPTGDINKARRTVELLRSGLDVDAYIIKYETLLTSKQVIVEAYE